MNGRVSLGAFGEVIEVWQTPDMGEARQVAGIVRGLGYKVLLSLGAGEKGSIYRIWVPRTEDKGYEVLRAAVEDQLRLL